MNIEITQINKDQKELFLNLYNFYLYDLSEYTGDELRDDGMFDPTNTYLYLERSELFPYFIKKNGRIIGFVLVCSPPFVDENIDFAIQELFVLRKYRGKNIAKQAVELVLGALEGIIRVEQVKANNSAVRFWNKFYEEHSILKLSEKEESFEIEGLEGIHTIIKQEFRI
ncbi:GNAT family N-acetyltransferase [Paenibacillus alvei]|uniref:GNAT family N-acetyltransferase n=1 Tax=Paenibacillus alvei TaxID=44250 RepID=A0ABT4H5W7_PAEAL|nr:GNAT family N-acetyltransferase [Paenibacillus alvei]MCY9764377.1 GNAT family N-acetyltransferase [Paenibacillus alvei]MCY9766905.1 GNAT family N-acetyltransferase [Paenibacillus alvei]